MKRNVNAEDEAPQLAPRSSAAGARTEAPKAPKGVRRGEGCPPPHRGRGWEGAVPPPQKNF